MNQTNRLGVSPDDQAVADAVARLATETLAPRAREIDEHGLSTTCHVPQLAALGVMGMNLPEQLGGAGVTPTAMLLSLVEISRACAATSSMIGAHYLGTDAVLIGGSPEQHARWLPRAASGEWLAGFALTEPRGGSHPADLRTRAVREGEHYRIDGVKHFISNAKEARFLVVFAKTDPEAGARGVSAFVVETDSPGISISSPEKLMGIQGAHAFEVAFDGVRVPAANRLGAEGTGFKTAMKVLEKGRIHIAAVAVGVAKRMLRDALAYSLERKQFGQAICDFQLVQAMLADSQAELYAAECMTLDAARRRDDGQNVSTEASCAKMFATEMCGRVADRAVQILGGAGYMEEYGIERFYRDVRLFRLYEGTTQIQQIIIARNMVREARDA